MFGRECLLFVYKPRLEKTIVSRVLWRGGRVIIIIIIIIPGFSLLRIDVIRWNTDSVNFCQNKHGLFSRPFQTISHRDERGKEWQSSGMKYWNIPFDCDFMGTVGGATLISFWVMRFGFRFDSISYKYEIKTATEKEWEQAFYTHNFVIVRLLQFLVWNIYEVISKLLNSATFRLTDNKLNKVKNRIILTAQWSRAAAEVEIAIQFPRSWIEFVTRAKKIQWSKKALLSSLSLS